MSADSDNKNPLGALRGVVCFAKAADNTECPANGCFLSINQSDDLTCRIARPTTALEDLSKNMNIIICGAGEVGSHAAEVLSEANHNITVIDTDISRIERLEDSMDIAAQLGNASSAESLKRAGVQHADLVLAATNSDDVNLVTSAVAKSMGAKKTIARVHHIAFYMNDSLNYRTFFNVDRLICPEFSTALALASSLRNPGAILIENIARGAIEMQEFSVSDNAKAVGRELKNIDLPAGSRLAAVTRYGKAFIPDAQTKIQPEDIVTLVGNAPVFQTARHLFHDRGVKRQRIAIMGGPPVAVWLCRQLRDRNFSIRLFEQDRQRAEVLATKLDWVTVIQADPTDPTVFEDEHIDHVDAFVALQNDDEDNILGCAWAKSMGVQQAMAIVQRSNYQHLLRYVGIDRFFSPRLVAIREINDVINERPLRVVASLADHVIDVVRLQVGEDAEVNGKNLKEIALGESGMIVVVDRGDQVFVPQADETIQAGDTLLVVAPHGQEIPLRKRFGVQGHVS